MKKYSQNQNPGGKKPQQPGKDTGHTETGKSTDRSHGSQKPNKDTGQKW